MRGLEPDVTSGSSRAELAGTSSIRPRCLIAYRPVRGRASRLQPGGRKALGQDGTDVSPVLGQDSADIEDLQIRRSDRIARCGERHVMLAWSRARSASALSSESNAGSEISCVLATWPIRPPEVEKAIALAAADGQGTRARRVEPVAAGVRRDSSAGGAGRQAASCHQSDPMGDGDVWGRGSAACERQRRSLHVWAFADAVSSYARAERGSHPPLAGFRKPSESSASRACLQQCRTAYQEMTPQGVNRSTLLGRCNGPTCLSPLAGQAD